MMTVLQRTNGITAEQKRLGRQISGRLTSKPLVGSTEMEEKLNGKLIEEQVRLVVPSKETAKMIAEGIIKTKQSGQISKLGETMQKSAEMTQQLIQMTGANKQKTKALTEQVSEMGAKTDMILEALKVAGVVLSQPAGLSATQLPQSGVGATPAAAPAAAGAPASVPVANAWLMATSDSGRRGGSKTRGAGGRGTGAPVGEDYDGLDDDDILVLPESPTLREQLRSGMRRVAALA